MTARDLYDRDETFRLGILAWASDRRCDLRLVDVLLEHDLPQQAAAAKWAAEQPDREVWCPLEDERERGGVCGTFPGAILCKRNDAEKTIYLLWRFDCRSELKYPDDLPGVPGFDYGDNLPYFATPGLAILWFLDTFVVPA